ncbi:MAG: HAMP domain-containing sensor histidine kinase [Chloroflexota bacterium]|nr:HAMP domain-containing sensor histidine kinase [Chloroflexota bacterium]
MFPKSIRWRLPLSYGAIALLAALALGVVLLTSLRGYYARQERDYLMGNVQEIARRMARLLALEAPTEVLQSQVDTFAFLSQTCVRLRDATGRVLADSGAPESVQVASGGAHAGEGDVIILSERARITPTVSSAQAGESFGITHFVITDSGLSTEPPVAAPVEAMPVAGTLYGFVLGQETTVPVVAGPRSDQSVRTDFYDQTGDLLGTVELSDGPAYGREIVNSVARAWAVASGVAVVLAAGVGWLVSRRMSGPLLALTGVTTQMAEGDLSARADVARQDEFGTLARSFNQMAGRVEETVTTLRRFVADAAHELHTPLTALRTNLELAAEAGPEEERSFVAQAQEQVARLEALTKGLLDLSRLEAGNASAPYEPLDLVALVRQVSEVYASRAEQAGIAFALDLPKTPVIVSGNADQLCRAVGNLLDNALKFTPAGGGVTLRLRPSSCSRQVELWVQDSGIGIPEEDLPHLFERFHRGRNATAYPGSGLGLVIVKAIVEAHGGRVRGENVEQGARFTVWLPRQR